MNTCQKKKNVIALLGIPGSGKTHYGNILSQRYSLKFLPEIPYEVIRKFNNLGYGKKGNLELDKKILEKNLERAYLLKRYLKGNDIILIDGHHYIDQIWLTYRMEIQKSSERNKILKKYQNEKIFSLLDKYTVFIILLVSIDTAIKRQMKRRKAEPRCISKDALEYVYKRIDKFYNEKKEDCILIDTEKEDENSNILKIENELSSRFKINLNPKTFKIIG